MRWMQIASDLTSFGGKHIPDIEAYFAAAGHPELSDDDLAWGVAVVGTCLAKSGVIPPKTLTGKSYLGVGTPVMLPRPGAIAVIASDMDTTAHRLAFVYSVKGDQIVAIGGHRAGLVGLDLVPRNKVIAFRWPSVTRGADWLKNVPVPAVPAQPAADPLSVSVPMVEAEAIIEADPVDEKIPDQIELLPPIIPGDRVLSHADGRDMSFKEILARVHGDADEDEPIIIEEPSPEDPGVYTDPWSPNGPDPIPDARPDPPEITPSDDEQRRIAQRAVRQVSQVAVAHTLGDQIRYELAMQAKNGSAYATDLLSGEARERGMTIAELADDVVAERKRQERRMMKIREIEARTIAAIEIAEEAAITSIAMQGQSEIEAIGKELS